MTNRIFFCLCFFLILNACGSLSETFGLKKATPDAFVAASQSPLAIPPSFDIHPPSPGAPRPQEETSHLFAKKSFFGFEFKTNPEHASPGERAFLSKIGKIDHDIRDKVRIESKKDDDKLLLDEWWGGNEDILDPTKEATRLNDPRLKAQERDPLEEDQDDEGVEKESIYEKENEKKKKKKKEQIEFIEGNF